MTRLNGTMSEIAAREIMGRPNAHMASIESLDHEGFDGVRIVMADAPVVARGKREGHPDWRLATNEETRIFSRADLVAAAEQWSARTGLCIECAGSGRTLTRIAVNEGAFFVRCVPCGGTGSRDGVTPSPVRREELHEATP